MKVSEQGKDEKITVEKTKIEKNKNEKTNVRKTELTLVMLSLTLAIAAGAFSFKQSLDNNKRFDQINALALQEKTDNANYTNALNKLHHQILVLEQRQTETMKQSIVAPNWAFEEAFFLVRMAEERIRVARDISGALQLLNTADHNLQSLNNPSLIPLRESIAKNRAALESIKMPDLDGMWVEVGTLIDSVPKLPTKGMDKSMQPTVEKKTETEETPGWQKGAEVSLHELKDLIKIRRHTKPIEPIIEDEEELLAKEHLRLMLSQIRFSILETKEKMYQESIKDALQWLNDYFESTNQQVIHTEDKLKSLAHIHLKPNLPSLQDTLQQFQSFPTLRQ